MGCTGQLLGALNPIEKGIWQAQNQVRQIQELLELQLQMLWELLQRQDLGLADPPDWLEPLFMWLTRIVAVLLAGFILYWLFRFVRYWALRWQKRVPDTPDIRQQSIEQPLAVQDWLAQAQQAQAQHNYALACRALYMALLVRLDEADWLVRNAAWTDQDYLRRLDALWVLHPRPVDLSRHWRHIFLTHEQSVYGKIPISAEQYQNCKRDYQTLETELNKGPLSEPEGP